MIYDKVDKFLKLFDSPLNHLNFFSLGISIGHRGSDQRIQLNLDKGLEAFLWKGVYDVSQMIGHDALIKKHKIAESSFDFIDVIILLSFILLLRATWLFADLFQLDVFFGGGRKSDLDGENLCFDFQKEL